MKVRLNSHAAEENWMTEEKQDSVEDQAEKTKPDNPQRTVKLGGILVFIIIIVSLVWYLLADRYTPYTSQARVEGYVVGVAPKVAGLVTEVWVKNNHEVEEGAPLFQIDPSQYEIALDKALADLESAKRQIDAGDASVLAARANLLAAQANEIKARKDYNRQKKLREDDPGTISVRRLEVAKATHDQAKANVTSAEANIQQAIEQKGGESDTNNTILKTAMSAVAKAELDLTNTTVTASTGGIITDLRAEVGQFAGTGAPVLTLISMHDVWITAAFTENNLGNLRETTTVEILFDVLPGQIFKGRVRSIGLGVSSGNSASAGTLPTIDNNRDWLRQAQRFPVIIEFSTDQEELYKQLRIGGQATVIAYCEETGFLNTLGRWYIRFMSYLSYAY